MTRLGRLDTCASRRCSEPVFFATPFAPDLALEEIAEFADDADLEQGIEAQDFIRRYVGSLTPREEEVIRLRFGIGGIGEHSRDEIGEIVGLTSSRIWQIEIKAMRKLQIRARSNFPVTDRRIEPPSPKSCRKPVAARRAGSSAKAQLPKGVTRRRRARRPNTAARHASISTQIEAETGIAGRRLRLFPRLILTIALALLTLACLVAWSETVGLPGKELFNTRFGTNDGPMIRLIVWCVSLVAGPLFGLFTTFAFEDLQDNLNARRRLGFSPGGSAGGGS